jgi:hypothetical protein
MRRVVDFLLNMEAKRWRTLAVTLLLLAGIIALFALGKTQLALGADDRLEHWLAGYRIGPWGLAAAVLVFTLSAFIGVPQFLLIAACVVAFGPWAGKVEPERFVPAAGNVFGLMVCMAGISACVSAADSHRWRTIGIMCGFYVTAILAKLVGRLSGPLGWIGYLSVLNAYEPQQLVGGGPDAWRLLGWYDGILLAIGLAAYAVGAVIFSRRDLPAPL